MLTIHRYVCEFCGVEYDSEEEAIECEALGFPEPMPFIPLGVPIPAFGENGVRVATVRSIDIRRGYDQHNWVVYAKPWPNVSHNLGCDEPIPAYAFDPRRGYDAFRYGATAADIAAWKRALAAYGFTEKDVGPLLIERVRDSKEDDAP